MSPRPAPSEIGRFYPSVVAEHIATSAPNPFALAEAQIVQDHCQKPGKILDIGCASGYFLNAMRQLGWQVYGVEPSPEAAHKASEVEGAQIKQGVLQPNDYEAGTFDVVTLWSVLEHLHDPLGTLNTVRRILKPSGHLHICVPNFRSLERYMFGPKWFGLDVPRHLYHFDPKSLIRLLTHSGFRVSQLNHSSGHDSLKSSLRLARGQEWASLSIAPTGMGLEPIAPAGPLRKAKRAMNKAVVNGFTRFADTMGQGSQIMVIAQPKSQQAS